MTTKRKYEVFFEIIKFGSATVEVNNAEDAIKQVKKSHKKHGRIAQKYKAVKRDY